MLNIGHYPSSFLSNLKEIKQVGLCLNEATLILSVEKGTFLLFENGRRRFSTPGERRNSNDFGGYG